MLLDLLNFEVADDGKTILYDQKEGGRNKWRDEVKITLELRTRIIGAKGAQFIVLHLNARSSTTDVD